MQRILAAAFGFLLVAAPRADIVNLSNGDRYVGEIQLVNHKEVQVKSEVVGLLKVPREKVASIYFGTNLPPAPALHATAPAASPWAPAVTSSREKTLKESIDPKSVEQVQQEFLGTATPEANEMFTELVQGLATGKLNVDDIRRQAADSLKELRNLQSEIGDEDDNPLLQGYVSILEKFIRAGGTNKPAGKSKLTPKQIVPTEDE